MLENRPSPDVLREALGAHRLRLEQGGPDVDRATAADLHVQLMSVLERWETLAPDDQAHVAEAVSYVARVNDDHHDIDDPDGLDDDARHVEELLARLHA